jgi:hypothetical protein
MWCPVPAVQATASSVNSREQTLMENTKKIPL